MVCEAVSRYDNEGLDAMRCRGIAVQAANVLVIVHVILYNFWGHAD